MINFFLKKRKIRKLSLLGFYKFCRGDIISIYYRLNGLGYSFTGICLAIKKKQFNTTNNSVLLRNVFTKVAVELFITFNNLCRMTISLLDFARKKFFYKKSKLYYLRWKININSSVK